MVCLTWPHLANSAEIYNAAGSLQTALGIISPVQQCLCRPSLNIWEAHVEMNGGTGFHHKAVKGELAGGHFNSSVNIMRSHPMSTQQTVYCRRSERQWRLLSGKARWFSQNTFWWCQNALDIFSCWFRSVSKVITREGRYKSIELRSDVTMLIGQ